MSAELLSSKVVVVEEPPRVRGVEALPTSIAGAVGVARRGPIGRAVLCTSFEDYEDRFGGFSRASDLALAALGFFQNGGSHLWVVRTAHYADPSNPSSASARIAVGQLVSGGAPTPAVVSGAPGPFALRDGDRLVLSANGAADAEVVFHGAPASATSQAGPFGLADGMTLLVRVDGGPVQDFLVVASAFADVARATAAEVAAALNADLGGVRALVERDAVRLQSDTRGTSSRLEIVGGTAVGPLGIAVGPAAGSGNLPSLRAVTAPDLVNAIGSSLPGVRATASASGALELRTTATGATASIEVRPGSVSALGLPAGRVLGSDAGTVSAVRLEGRDPGAFANHLQVELRAATSGERERFDLLVFEDGVFRERWVNLSLDAQAARPLELTLNDEQSGSRLIRVSVLGTARALEPQIATLAGGDDGLVGLVDADFVGAEAGRTGLFGLDRVLDLSLVTVPRRATPTVHEALVRYAEQVRGGFVFAVLDPPAGLDAVAMVDYVERTAALLGASEHAAIYWPRIRIPNPSRSVFGGAVDVVAPPSGAICGAFARTDAASPGGIYDPPAGIDRGRLLGVLGFETDEVLEERRRDLVYPKRINPLTTAPGLPRFIDGSRTLRANGSFPYVAERRGVSFIERSLRRGLEFARHRSNTEDLRAEVARTITAFLVDQMRNGAFASSEADKAFFVDVSETLNPPSARMAGRMYIRVGLATNKPAEFIVLRIAQDTRALEAELAAGG